MHAMEEKSIVERQYFNKTKRIDDHNKKRTMSLMAEIEDIRKKNEVRKQKHAEEYKKVRETEEKTREELRERVISKSLRFKPSLDVLLESC